MFLNKFYKCSGIIKGLTLLKILILFFCKAGISTHIWERRFIFYFPPPLPRTLAQSIRLYWIKIACFWSSWGHCFVQGQPFSFWRVEQDHFPKRRPRPIYSSPSPHRFWPWVGPGSLRTCLGTRPHTVLLESVAPARKQRERVSARIVTPAIYSRIRFVLVLWPLCLEFRIANRTAILT